METILLVHDDLRVLDQLRSTLSEVGFRLVSCERSMAALGLLDGPDQFDMLVTRVRFKEPPHGVSLALMARLKRRLAVLFVADPSMESYTFGVGGFVPSSGTPEMIVAAALRALRPQCR